MTVRELIEKLLKEDPAREVWLETRKGDRNATSVGTWYPSEGEPRTLIRAD